ncbi:hypothetical protein [Spongiactinospora sp. TRM90649]|uniref:hypothetical protein n=1 Tax=Spongiactinospora sp. TRM90649 TaxID=3031114 RepID=UPI0023F65973|nr:hypothetical protein [Spongiactinospora sp. TRM90649]MDF5758009.1 hypothetical protein [Spongiactinospora sp. TRM90649]
MNRHRIALALVPALVLAGGTGIGSAAVVAAAPSEGATVRAAAGQAPGWRVVLRERAGSAFAALAAAGGRDAWAAGSRVTKEFDPRSGDDFTAPLIKQWDGGRWRALPSPKGPPGFPLRELTLVAASSRAEVWTAGTAVAAGRGDVASSTRSAVSRWDGRRWRLMGSGRTTVTDLEVVGRDAWIVGADARTGRPFFKRFHAGRWSGLPAPAGLRRIAVRSAREVWGLTRTSVLRFDGRSWRAVALPALAVPVAPEPAYGRVRPRPDAVAADASGVWVAVGFQQGDWPQPGAALLRRTAGGWRQARLPKDVVGALSPDGRGGVWAASRQETIKATPDGQDPYAYTTLSTDVLRYTGAGVTRGALPVRPGFEWSGLAALPGGVTGGVLAAGYEWRPPQGAVVLRYGG